MANFEEKIEISNSLKEIEDRQIINFKRLEIINSTR